MTFIDILNSIFGGVAGGNRTLTTCEDNIIDHYKFYQYSLIPAILLTLLFASTKTRRQRLIGVLGGRPGLIYPMDTLTRESRISYCCAFGATAFLVYQILLEQRFAIDYHGPVSLLTLIAILTMFVYGIVFFPVFACLALNSAFSNGLGSLYVWMFFIVDVYNVSECDLTAEGRTVMLARSLPSLGCLLYLSISLSMRFVVCCYRKQFFTGPEKNVYESLNEIKDSYQGLHVRKLLKRPKIEDIRELDGVTHSAKRYVMSFIRRWTYHVQPGFRYPSQLVSVLFVASCVIYMITVELTFMFVDLFSRIRSSEDEQETANLFHHLEVSLNLGIYFSLVISFLNIIHVLSSFRSNLFAMYKGDFKYIPPASEKSAVWLCAGSIKYAGFQVAYIVWAYIILWIVLFIFFFIFVIVCDGYLKDAVIGLLQIWPGVVIGLILRTLQMLLAKYVFLQDGGDHLRLDNRHSYFIFAYFMFFFNIFLGLLSCLLRILKAIAIGTFFMARLDSSTLPRKFEYFDPGLQAYIGYIHLEAAHTHPVANVFIRILVSFSRRRKTDSSDPGIEISDMSSSETTSSKGKEEPPYDRLKSLNVSARFKWFVVYTLLHNPQIRVYRRGYMQTAKRARKEGLRVPISDQPFSPFDIVQLQREREENRQAGMAPSGRQISFSLFGPRSRSGFGSSSSAPSRSSPTTSNHGPPEAHVEVRIPEVMASTAAQDMNSSGGIPRLSLFPEPVGSRDNEVLVNA